MSSARRLCLRAVCAVFGLLAPHEALTAPSETPIGALPILEPAPDSVEGLPSFSVSLDGTWLTSSDPAESFWQNGAQDASWTEIPVPTPMRHTVNVPDARAAKPYACRHTFTVPRDFSGKRVLLRFDGVSCTARVWVDGHFVREHTGSYLTWTCDITDCVTPGREARLDVGIDDRPLGLNAFLRPGGIFRGVRLMAVPVTRLTRFQAEPTLDAAFRDATLHLRLRMDLGSGSGAGVDLRLTAPDGSDVPLDPRSIRFDPSRLEQEVDLPVRAPSHWDAEHPRLYTLAAIVSGADGKPLERLSRKVGFRQVAVVGNRMFVNGREVKMRGICGFPDIARLKELNVNHVRQKFGTEAFLDDADRLGIYVLDESPIDFAKYGVETDPRYAGTWLSITAELMERDWSHPSVVMWGLGNESFPGPNVLKAFRFVQAEDHQRPVDFSWANRVPVDQELPYSFYSSHYPNLNDPDLNLGDYDVALWHSPSLVRLRQPRPVMPVLHDEYAHVILSERTILRDPNVRNFWGESIYRFWEKMFVTPGALGGDQFGIGLRLGRGNLPNGPEFYLLKEAYAPVRIANRPLGNPGAGKPLRIEVGNWYDHTNLAELQVAWEAGPDRGTLAGPSVEPHSTGALSLPARSWRADETVHLTFTDADHRLVNEFRLPLSPAAVAPARPAGPAPRLDVSPSEFVISGAGFRVVFDRYRGLIKEGSYHGDTVIVDGPFLSLLGSGLAYSEWWCDHLDARVEGNEAVVTIRGNYAVIAASFEVRIDGEGTLRTRYSVDHVPGRPPPPVYSPWDATSVGGYTEVGISFVMPASVNRLSWRRLSLWSVYPEDHIGRPDGTAVREPSREPHAAWGRLEDPAGAGSNDWRGMKEAILSASAWTDGSAAALSAVGDGTQSVRLAVDPGSRSLTGGIRLLVDNDWNYEDFGLGNYARPALRMGDGYSNTVTVRLGPRP